MSAEVLTLILILGVLIACAVFVFVATRTRRRYFEDFVSQRDLRGPLWSTSETLSRPRPRPWVAPPPPPPPPDPPVTEDASWIATASGGQFHVLAPEPGEVRIEDIAHALARICRFGGHCRRFYSVAQHSVLVSQLVPTRLALHGLLHDAAEAYVGDVVRPLKQELPGYKIIEARVERAVELALDIEPLSAEDSAIVKHADRVALVTERRDLITSCGVGWVEDECGFEPHPTSIFALPPTLAETQFLRRFEELTGTAL